MNPSNSPKPDVFSDSAASSHPPAQEEPTLLPKWEEAPTLLPGSDLPSGDDDRTRKFLETWDSVHPVEGETIGRYHRLHRIGSWRFGSIYEAEHSQLHRRVRLLMLEPPGCGNPALKQWFLSQTRAIAGIPAASVASSVLECDEIGDIVFLCVPSRTPPSVHPLREYARHARFTQSMEPLSNAFYMLLQGLRTFHEQGLVHGGIDTCHIAVDNTAEEVQFDPFGTGMPEADLIGENGEPCEDRIAIQSEDCKQLARAFVAILLDVPSSQLPSQLTWRWIVKRLPFFPADLAKLLSELSASGLRSKKGVTALASVGEMRYSAMTNLPWIDRLLSMLRHGLFVVLLSLVVMPVYILLDGRSSDDGWVSMLLSLLIGSFVALTFFEIFAPRLSLRSEFSRILIDWDGGVPSLGQRSLRALGRIGSVLGLATLLTVLVVVAIPWLKGWIQGDDLTLEIEWSVIFFGMLFPAILLACCTPLLFRGRMFHDWLSRTVWVRRSTSKHEPILQSKRQDTPRGFLGNPLAEFQSDDTPLEFIDGIHVERELGVGGMGIVYRGMDESLQRPVALKVISAFSPDTEEIVQRFRREARLGSIMNHPNIAKVYRVGFWENRPFMEMEFVDGETLQQIVSREGPVDIERAWAWIRQAASGLLEADQHGIIHRDIKPTNLMVRHDGLVKLMDFGISKSLKDDPSEDQPPEVCPTSEVIINESPDAGLTRAGAILGTPQYMSPEQVRCEPLDRRSDIYSLGLTLYYLLSGRTAIEGSGIYDVMARQCTDSPPPLPPKTLSKPQQRVLEKMLAKSKEDRFQNYETLIAAIDESKPEELRLPSTSRRFTALFIDTVLVFLVLILVDGSLQIGHAIFESFGIPSPWERISLLANPWVFLIYHVGSMVWLQGTPGQGLLGLRVVRKDGGRIGWKEALVRFVGKYPFITLSWLLTSAWVMPESSNLTEARKTAIGILQVATMVFWIVSYLVVNFNYSTHRKAIHDYLAGTQIVYAKRGWIRGRFLNSKRS